MHAPEPWEPLLCHRQVPTPRTVKEQRIEHVAQREVSLPRNAAGADDLELVIKLHRVEKHIRKNKLKAGPHRTLYPISYTLNPLSHLKPWGQVIGYRI